MQKTLFWGLALTALLAASCTKDDTPAEGKTLTYDFNQGQQGWTVGFADYDDEHTEMELLSQMAKLPRPLDTAQRALMVQGHNRTDDLFMFLKTKVTGLDTNQVYRVRIDVRLASDAPSGAVGIGGPPGEGVTLKAGATPIEPLAVKQANGWYEMNIRKGNQSQPGEDMKVIGHVANGTDKTQYASIVRSSGSQVITVKTNNRGECWLILGTDSGYEGLTRLYYQRVAATFVEEN